MTITKELEATIQLAIAEAKRRRHEYLTLEHLLVALCADPTASRILKACGVNFKRLLAALEAHLATLEQRPEQADDDDIEIEADSEDEDGDDDTGEVKPRPGDPRQTPAFWRVLQRAAMHVHSSGKDAIDGGNVLVALFRERDSQAAHILEGQGVSRLDVLRFVAHGITKTGGVPSGAEPERGDEIAGVDDEEGGAEKDPLAAYTVNLIERAKAGKIDPLIGRTDELQRMVQVLCRRRKNNPVLVGDPGVGKTALVEGLALAVHDKRVPSLLDDSVIFSLDMGALLAGTKFRGEFEQRLKGVISAIQKDPKAILFIDEIHTIVGAGATSGGSIDASNLLKPALASGDLRCIGSTTFPEYKSSFERDRALARRFQKIEIYEPSVEETVLILAGLKSRYEEHHEVKYSDPALRAAAELSAKYVADRYLPDKAIDVLDEAGSRNRLLSAAEKKAVLGTIDIEVVVAKMAKIPEKSVSSNDEEQLAQLEPRLKQVIFGQDTAIDALASAIKLTRAGLGPADRPIGSFLFSGPTGVGKTELARQMAKVLGVEFLRYDMSEYMEKHTVSRLIGAPPGYVGFDQGGLLTDAVRKTPYAVIVLDEIEKAHPDVFNILLQVMDHATLTDNNGRKADFRHVILILTTNAGARDLTAKSLGFAQGATKPTTRELSKSAIERTFSPEFRNRLDGWIVFDPLAMDSIRLVVDKVVAEMAAQLRDKKISLTLAPEARDWLAEKGFDPLFGARPMARLVQNELKKPLADAILFGVLKNGGSVRVTVIDGKIALDTKAA